MSMSIVCTGLGFAWPDGTVVFDGLNLAVGAGRTGLIGANGAGKSTLLRLIAGDLRPARGSVQVTGELGYLRQSFTLDADRRVDDVLGIAAARAALLAIERGDTSDAHFTAVGDDWGVEERTRVTLDRLGLGHIGLDWRVGQLSGGESILFGLAAQLLRRPNVLLLDEPTNNLDLGARRRLYAAVASWPGVLVVVSHDRELLELVDQIAEVTNGDVTNGDVTNGDVTNGDVRWYGGNLSAYEQAVAVEQKAAERMVRAAEADVRRQHRDLIDARVKLDRRVRYGRKMEANKREPKIVMGARKRQAQVSAAKHRSMHMDRLADARNRLSQAEEAVRDDTEIRVDLPETRVPAGRTVLVCADAELRYGGTVSLAVRGPERIALVGANGTGKTTLLRTIAGELAPESGQVRVDVPVRYLPQRLDLLDDAVSIVNNLRGLAPDTSDNAVRARLARFLFRGGRADQPVGTLSGGERFRATLAALLSATPAPQLLMLDEPTNNLDMASVRQLSQALSAYRGALLVAAHDLPFLRSIGITRWLRLDGDLTEVDPM